MQSLVAERESNGIICKWKLVCIATDSLWHFGELFLLRKKITVAKALKGQVGGIAIKPEIIRKDQGPLRMASRVLMTLLLIVVLGGGWVVWTYRGPGPSARQGAFPPLDSPLWK